MGKQCTLMPHIANRIRLSSGCCHSAPSSSLVGTFVPSIGQYANAIQRSDCAAIPWMTAFNSSSCTQQTIHHHSRSCSYFLPNKLMSTFIPQIAIERKLHSYKILVQPPIYKFSVSEHFVRRQTFCGDRLCVTPFESIHSEHKPRMISAAPFQWPWTIPSESC